MKIVLRLIIGVIALFAIALMCINVTQDAFWSASLLQILTLLVAVFLAFWATQYKNDERRKKEHAAELLDKIQGIVNETDFYDFSTGFDKREITIKQRKVNNTIALLGNYAKKFKFEQEYDYIKNQYEEYSSFLGNHIMDKPFLIKSKVDFEKWANSIDMKCDTIKIIVFK